MGSNDAPKLLAGGNPQIPKGAGPGPVRDYIAAMPGWKHDVGQLLDSIIERTVPDVRKAVKWNSPLYGAADRDGWFLSLHCFDRYVKVTFFRGTSLTPVPPGASRTPETRSLDVHEDLDEFDEAQFADWVAQASNVAHEKL